VRNVRKSRLCDKPQRVGLRASRRCVFFMLKLSDINIPLINVGIQLDTVGQAKPQRHYKIRLQMLAYSLMRSGKQNPKTIKDPLTNVGKQLDKVGQAKPKDIKRHVHKS